MAVSTEVCYLFRQTRHAKRPNREMQQPAGRDSVSVLPAGAFKDVMGAVCKTKHSTGQTDMICSKCLQCFFRMPCVAKGEERVIWLDPHYTDNMPQLRRCFSWLYKKVNKKLQQDLPSSIQRDAVEIAESTN